MAFIDPNSTEISFLKQYAILTTLVHLFLCMAVSGDAEGQRGQYGANKHGA